MVDRRAFLKVGSLGVFGSLAWSDVLALRARAAAPAPKDISIIHILLSGGMSHIDTLDMKPEARPEFRGVFKPINTNVSGIQICEHLPMMARQVDKYTIIRSMTHKNSVHEKASYLVLSGHEPVATVHHPSLGAVIVKELGPRNELPPYISIPGMTGLGGSGSHPGQVRALRNRRSQRSKILRARHQAAHGRGLGPYGSPEFAALHGRLRVSALRRQRRFDTVDAFQKTAYDLIRSPRTKRAFALQEEPETVRERYGRTPMGQGALLARRLVENGVRFVTVSNGYYKWDHHAKVFESLSDRYLPELDRAFSALIEDLHQRGMLDNTLVVMTGEFGRTPEVNVNAGRDHWPNVFSLIIAGAGVPGGQVWGSSDSEGAQVRDNPVEVPDLIATIYSKVGIDYQKEYVSNIGRPFKLSDGKPLPFLSRA